MDLSAPQMRSIGPKDIFGVEVVVAVGGLLVRFPSFLVLHKSVVGFGNAQQGVGCRLICITQEAKICLEMKSAGWLQKK